MAKIRLFGLSIEDTTLHEAARCIVQEAASEQRRHIYFVNAHCVNVAANNANYLNVLVKADRLYADGIGMRLAAKLAGISLVDNVNGTDLFPLLCQYAASAGVSLALLGASPGIAERCADNMQQRYPGLKIVWINHGYFSKESEPDILQGINSSGAGMLFVAMGVPQQELWLARYASMLKVPVLLGVGALFDFYSGSTLRAPLIIRRIGMEWLYRFVVEPRRLFFRYIIGNPVFISRMLWRRLGGKINLQNSPLK